MADVITRLKLDSGEYDSKIKRATQGLLQMEQECRKVGGTLAVLEKDQLDYVRSLGQMETVSRSARGKVSELTAAFTELSVQYKHLTDEEKKGDYGKALSASLNQLKGRINEAKNELADVDTYGMILRAKGMVASSEGEEWIHFDYVPKEPDVRFGRAIVCGRICVIGSKIDEDKLKELFGA